MTATQTIPLWIWLLFCVLLVGLVTLIYSRGNWRATISFVAIAAVTVLAIGGLDTWTGYLNSHFLGGYDQLGIPYQQTRSAWQLEMRAWPIWILPSILAAVVGFVAGYWWLKTKDKPAIPLEDAASIAEKKLVGTAVDSTDSTKNLAQRLKDESTHQELHEAQEKLSEMISLYEKQITRNYDLTTAMEQNSQQHYQELKSLRKQLEDKISALQLEVDARSFTEQRLTQALLETTEKNLQLEAENKHE